MNLRFDVCSILILSGLTLFSATYAKNSVNPAWAADPFWDQGKAEISVYKANLPREGMVREGEVTHILVKEDHLPAAQVKAENWKQMGLLPRLKFNEITRVQTGRPSYHQMISVFFDRLTLVSPKLVFTSQDWCGQTYKELRINGDKGLFSFSSYWEGEGKGERALSLAKDIVPYNALPVILRAWQVGEGATNNISILSDLVSNRATSPRIFEGKITWQDSTSVIVLGKPTPSQKATVTWNDGTSPKEDRLWFSKESLHPLLRWERSDGGTYELEKRTIDAYWNQK